MRTAFAVLAFAALAGTAQAGPVTMAPVSFSPALQTTIQEDYGEREAEILSEYVSRSVREALEARGAALNGPNAPVTVEISILDAKPNRPTFEQLTDRPSLDFFRSISVGGAELQATLRAADGRVLDEVTHRRFNTSIDELTGAENTWSEARRAIRRFADKVADAYQAHAG